MQARVRKQAASKWETVGGGALAPLWSPGKEGEFIVIRLQDLRAMGKFGGRQSWGLVCRLEETNSTSFFAGKGKQRKRIALKPGDNVAVPLSAALEQSNLAVQTEGKNAKPQWGSLGTAARKNNIPLRIEFQGEVGIGGKQRVKRMLVQAPSGVADKLRA